LSLKDWVKMGYHATPHTWDARSVVDTFPRIDYRTVTEVSERPVRLAAVHVLTSA
jgi:hypothetical protein